MSWLNALVFLAVLLSAAVLLARYMHVVFEGSPRRGEIALYRVCGIDPRREMGWAEYALAALALSLVTTLSAYALMRTQQWHGSFFNPQHSPNVDPWIAWNTALSFITTTDWQFYSGENTMSYLSQMAALAWLNFVAGAIGLAAGVAVIRGFARRGSATLGNFWVDCTRSLFLVLLPLCILFGLLFAAQGIPQNFSRYVSVTNAHRAARGTVCDACCPDLPVHDPVRDGDLVRYTARASDARQCGTARLHRDSLCLCFGSGK